jgi:hypothetical protein
VIVFDVFFLTPKKMDVCGHGTFNQTQGRCVCDEGYIYDVTRYRFENCFQTEQMRLGMILTQFILSGGFLGVCTYLMFRSQNTARTLCQVAMGTELITMIHFSLLLSTNLQENVYAPAVILYMIDLSSLAGIALPLIAYRILVPVCAMSPPRILQRYVNVVYAFNAYIWLNCVGCSIGVSMFENNVGTFNQVVGLFHVILGSSGFIIFFGMRSVISMLMKTVQSSIQIENHQNVSNMNYFLETLASLRFYLTQIVLSGVMFCFGSGLASLIWKVYPCDFVFGFLGWFCNHGVAIALTYFAFRKVRHEKKSSKSPQASSTPSNPPITGNSSEPLQSVRIHHQESESVTKESSTETGMISFVT